VGWVGLWEDLRASPGCPLWKEPYLAPLPGGVLWGQGLSEAQLGRWAITPTLWLGKQ
jgi:hypothetical protein